MDDEEFRRLTRGQHEQMVENANWANQTLRDVLAPLGGKQALASMWSGLGVDTALTNVTQPLLEDLYGSFDLGIAKSYPFPDVSWIDDVLRTQEGLLQHAAPALGAAAAVGIDLSSKDLIGAFGGTTIADIVPDLNFGGLFDAARQSMSGATTSFDFAGVLASADLAKHYRQAFGDIDIAAWSARVVDSIDLEEPDEGTTDELLDSLDPALVDEIEQALREVDLTAGPASAVEQAETRLRATPGLRHVGRGDAALISTLVAVVIAVLYFAGYANATDSADLGDFYSAAGDALVWGAGAGGAVYRSVRRLSRGGDDTTGSDTESADETDGESD